MTRLDRVYPSALEAAEELHEKLVELLDREKVAPDLTQCFLLAVSEAFTNALLHGNKRDPEKKISVSVLVNETSLSADISDEGTGGLQKVTGRKRPDILAESGRGIDLIKHYADAVSFDATASGGLKVSIRFDRRKATRTEQR